MEGTPPPLPLYKEHVSQHGQHDGIVEELLHPAIRKALRTFHCLSCEPELVHSVILYKVQH